MHDEFYGPVARVALLLICVLGALWSAALLLPSGRRAESDSTAPGFTAPEFVWSHLFMLGAMAVMFGDATDTIDAAVWRWLFGAEAVVLAVYLVVLATRRDAPSRGERIGAGLYHLLASVAMIYTLTGHAGESMHHHHGQEAGALPWPAVGWILATVFAVDAIGVVAMLVGAAAS